MFEQYEDSPCRYCVPPERYAGCHAHCKKYKRWSAGRKEKIAVQRKAKNRLAELEDYKIHSAEKMHRRGQELWAQKKARGEYKDK